ncbi:hypothetical protein [Comamonas aquatica]|uniref:DUF7822 domain-containing protein n=1 Tax=Comamonas aquatica TaxID=225991 RepID=UPI00391DEE73
MPNYALLLAHDERPTATTLWPTEPGLPGAVCEGWAEWFNHMPLLFSLLMGDALHLPERVPCSFYQEADSLSALAAPMAQVQARWAWLKHLLGAAPGNWPAALAQQWQAIDHTITTSQRQWLLLDCATLCPHDLGTPEFAAFLQTQRDQCLLWDCSASSLPQALQALKQHPDHQLGWWNPAVVARTATIKHADSDDWPSWLAEGYEERYYAAWEEEIDAYQVIPRLHPRTGQPCRTEDEREHWPVGLVTPYGRWLLAPQAGAHSAFASGGCINLSFPPQAPGQDERCGIQDANGLWLVHPNLGHREAWALTPQLMQSRTAEGRYALHRLPDLALLHSGLTAIDLFPDDQLIRARRSDDTVMVLDASGQPLFDSPYEHVLNFNPKNGLAVAFQRQRPGDRSSPLLEGVLHRSGTLRVPCAFAQIERGFNDSPPKVFPGGKLLAYSPEGQPRVFNTQGQLLSAPDLWCPPLARTVKKNLLLAGVGSGPEAAMGWFSLKDFSFTPTGETWGDITQALRRGLEGGTDVEVRVLRRSDLVDAEDTDWMQDVARTLCLGDAEAATALVATWRAAVAQPDPDDFGWDTEDPDFDPDLLELCGEDNDLTLYWQHLLAVGPQFARLDWKDADGLAGSRWLPGAHDWHWDTSTQGHGMEDGFDSLAQHLAPQQLALVRLRTSDDSLRFVVVRQPDAADLLDRLAQAAVDAWVHAA